MGVSSNDVVLDYNPDKFPSKFKKFVTELPVLMDTVKLANVNLS
jgi:hypothetical protein